MQHKYNSHDFVKANSMYYFKYLCIMVEFVAFIECIKIIKKSVYFSNLLTITEITEKSSKIKCPRLMILMRIWRCLTVIKIILQWKYHHASKGSIIIHYLFIYFDFVIKCILDVIYFSKFFWVWDTLYFADFISAGEVAHRWAELCGKGERSGRS